jgi:glutaconate CoA-transferase subunit A
LSKAAQIPAQWVTGPALLRDRPEIDFNAPPTIDEQMVVTLARHYSNESICSAGAVSPLAIVSYMLAKKTHAPDLVMMMISGGLVDPAVRPMLVVLAEALDFQTSILHCGGDDTYHWYYQRGLISHEVVSAAQIDKYGRANNIFITTPSGKRIRLPGQGGMADVANLHQHFLMYITRHSPLTLVDEVEYASAARGLLTDEERQAVGLHPGYMRLVTDLGVFELNKMTRLLELVSVHPGVTIEQVKEATGFPLRQAPNVGVTEPPTQKEIELIRTEIDPLGIRRLEFVSARDRASMITELLNYEEAVIAELIQ